MRFLPIFLLLCAPAMGSESPYHAIVYHDIRDDVAGDFDPDQYAVSTRNLIAHFSWLRDNDFQPISMDQIIAAQEGRQNLPDKAVLLTFDDGLLSVYTKVFPLLKLFNYPAVVSVVTNWVGTEDTVVYANREFGHQGFLTWDQIRELRQEPLGHRRWMRLAD